MTKSEAYLSNNGHYYKVAEDAIEADLVHAANELDYFFYDVFRSEDRIFKEVKNSGKGINLDKLKRQLSDLYTAAAMYKDPKEGAVSLAEKFDGGELSFIEEEQK